MVAADGLDLRDWVAGQALAGILMHPATPRPGESPMYQHAEALAEQAYAYADAMLRLRRRAEAAAPRDVPGAFNPAEEAAEAARQPGRRRKSK